MALFLLCPNLGWIQGQFNFTELSLRYLLDTFSSHHAIVVGQYAAGNGIRLVLSSRVLGAYLSKTRLNSNIVGYLTIYELVDVLNN